MRALPRLLVCHGALILLSASVLLAGEPVAKVTTRAGESYEQVKVVSRVGDTIKIMHSGGVKTLSLADFNREDAISLGLLEYEAEKQAATEAAAKQAKAQKVAQEALMAARKSYLQEVRSKKRKAFRDWLDFVMLSGSTVSLANLKACIGRPPDIQSGDTFIWQNVCWNPNTEKMDSLTLSPSSVPRMIDNQVVRIGVSVLESGSESFASFDRTNAEFLEALDKRLLAPK